jgi:coenzyme F420-reducing hydrogenase delta subunit
MLTRAQIWYHPVYRLGTCPGVGDHVPWNRWHSMSNRDLKICLFYCSNSCDGARLAESCAKVGAATLKTIGLPCSGKVNLPYLVKAFETGADGVAIVTCREEECKNLEGNLRARKRADAVQSLLDEIGMGPGRVAVLSVTDPLDELCTQLEAFCCRIRQESRPLHVAARTPDASRSAS